MYLVDHEIKKLLDELAFDTTDPQHPFNGGDQIQPCSIDVRLSSVFWKPSRRRRLWRRVLRFRERTIDLRRTNLHAIDPLRDWKKLDLREGHTLTIQPGQIIMGRVYERFRIPLGYAGKIEGRSSFARLGLSVHCTGDFINPGWEGYMPLQLYNAGPYPLKIVPYISVCQLMLIPLSATPDRSYGDPDLDSKYANDDGGPSLWWRDSRIRELQRRLGTLSVSEGIMQEIVEAARPQSPSVLDRLQHHIDHTPAGRIENADQMLGAFARKEDRRKRTDTAAIWVAGLFLAGFVATLFADLSLTIWHIVLLAVTLVVALCGFGGWVRREGGYMGKAQLSQVRPAGKA